jgi:2-(1,2-epoxy-1,2-dihydrophenyl)acetyl-CoA isomerase
MTFQMIESETHDGVLLLRLNDPARRNAVSGEMMREIDEELDRLEREPALRVLVLTGTDPAFCSGANVRGFQASLDGEAEQPWAPPPQPTPWEQLDPSYYGQAVTRAIGPQLVLRLHHMQKPSIAAVNGPAYGVGCGFALACDLRIASEKARFSEAFVRMGMVPADGSCWQLPRLIGVANTLLLQYTGEPIDGAEAYRLGMVNQVVPHEALMETTMQLATRLAQGASYSMALIKALVHKGLGQSLEEHLIDAFRALGLASKTEDHREGVRAFLEKRQPLFKGR